MILSVDPKPQHDTHTKAECQEALSKHILYVKSGSMFATNIAVQILANTHLEKNFMSLKCS